MDTPSLCRCTNQLSLEHVTKIEQDELSSRKLVYIEVQDGLEKAKCTKVVRFDPLLSAGITFALLTS